jgi:vacuolar-type H+-ATPase subunit I/STV1
LHCPSCFDLQLLLTPLVSSTFSFNSISVISCRSVLLFGETGVLGEDYRPVAIHWNKCIMESCIEYILPWAVFKLIGLVVIGTACTCSRKSNYQSITTTMANWSQLTACVPNVASFSFLIALSIFSNVYSLLINTLCWSFVDDMNSLFAFQNK